MMESYCGICNTYFTNWHEHINTPEHKEKTVREAR